PPVPLVGGNIRERVGVRALESIAISQQIGRVPPPALAKRIASLYRKILGEKQRHEREMIRAIMRGRRPVLVRGMSANRPAVALLFLAAQLAEAFFQPRFLRPRPQVRRQSIFVVPAGVRAALKKYKFPAIHRELLFCRFSLITTLLRPLGEPPPAHGGRLLPRSLRGLRSRSIGLFRHRP